MTAEDFSPAYWKFRFKFFFRLRVRALLARYPSRFCYYIFPHLLSCFFSQPSKLDGNYITEHWGNGPQPTTFLLFFFSPPRWLPFTAWAVIFQSLSSLLLFLAFSLDHHAEGTLEQRELADLIYLLHRNGVWAAAAMRKQVSDIKQSGKVRLNGAAYLQMALTSIMLSLETKFGRESFHRRN